MRTTPKLLTSLIKPITSTRALSSVKISDLKTATDDIKITPLRPHHYEDFETFKQIITNQNIVFTSSWIDKWFGIEKLKKECRFMSQKIEMFESGDREISISEETIRNYKQGVSPTQIALNRFFNIEENKKMLREVYLQMTGRVEQTGLGYYKFEDNGLDLLGGGALAPISDCATKVDIALHILKPKQGIGSSCLEKLLDIAFKEQSVEQVWGSSIIDHPGTPTLCAKHGMIIQNVNGMKYYFIDKSMREASQGKANFVLKHPMAASTHYIRNSNPSSNNIR